jgi:hypothetical protein
MWGKCEAIYVYLWIYDTDCIYIYLSVSLYAGIGTVEVE